MKDALLDYIFDNCDAAYISDLRQKMIFQEYADMILEIEDTKFSVEEWNYVYRDGLDTLVGTGGTYLSGGENQRIALARAILKDAPIIVLDEATAFADAENEHQIQLAFERLTQNKTVMMIAHRLSTIQDADLILVFKEGQIAERGTHEELVALNGIYSSMWKDYQTSIAWKVGKEDEQHD